MTHNQAGGIKPVLMGVAIIVVALLLTGPAIGQPVVHQAGLIVKPFAGPAAGGPPILGTKFSVIDHPAGAHGGFMYVAELGGVGVVKVLPNGSVVQYTQPFGPFGSGASGICIDAMTADLPGPTMGLYGGPVSMFAAQVAGGGRVNIINPGGPWGPYTPALAFVPGAAGLMIDRTPGFMYGGFMYVSDWGNDGSDGIRRVLPGGAVAAFAALPNRDPRYFTFDVTGGATGYGPNALWVSSFSTGAVFSVSPAGIAAPALANVGAGAEGISFGHGDAIFGSSMYVANLTNGTIDKILPGGMVVRFASGFPGAAYLQFVTSGPYAIGGQPALYVDDGGSSIYVITPVGAPKSQATFSIDFQGPPKGFPDGCSNFPITEGDILSVSGSGANPCIFISGGVGPPGPGLGLPLHGGAVGLPPGQAGRVEVDALSYGRDGKLDPNSALKIKQRVYWHFSVDEWATGIPGAGRPPNVWTEGASAGSSQEASADIFIDWPMIGPGPLAPGLIRGNTGTADGNGVAPPAPVLAGMKLMEPNPRAPGVPDPGSNLDALDVDTAIGETWPVYFSLDSGYVFDPLETFPGTGSAAANFGFVGGDVLVAAGPGGPSGVFAPAALLGLDRFGRDTDDLDALILWENGTGVYEPPIGPYSWVFAGTDMLLFSVRRGSAIIGRPDSLFGAPIEPGDILLPPFPGGPMTPGIWIPAESLGLMTARMMGVQFGDDLNAADVTICVPCDVNCDGTVNPFDIQPFLDLLMGTGTAPCSPCAGDANLNGTVNPFDINDFLTCLS